MIKVCGMRDAENIRAVEALGVDWIGLIFWPKSKRYVSERPAFLPQQAKRVGVFVDEEAGRVMQIADDYALDFIQLHGHESPEYISMLKDHRLIKAFNIATPSDFMETKSYEGLVDYFLFDTKGKSVGGNGEKFDWSILSHYQGSTPFILSGGIGPDDTERVKSFRHPGCIGIDLNSRFELEPGLKDIKRLKDFIDNIKQ